MIAEGGDIVARGRRFGFQMEEEVTFYDVNLELGRVGKLRNQPYSGRPLCRRPTRSQCTRRDWRRGPEIGGEGKTKVMKTVSTCQSDLSTGFNCRASMAVRDEFIEAEMLGLFDYLAENHHAWLCRFAEWRR